ncbi:oxidoreductase [Salipiger mangrovisoli]|uniref:Oxidoreductase n=1 Tax=Salipiger mangrovisoli TaxID=2865933 RepID=A0ABR9X9X6_9RHOB|nr:oxidoreductase [Salipiger mangrovisoli]MBE9640414.1 oxidoreductase [Salipiger mangrovisoli]
MFRLPSLRAVISLAVVATPLAAGDLPVPEENPVLVVSGAITNTNVGGTASFDYEMLEAMDTVTFTTKTIWTDGEQTFTGVQLSDLMALVGAEGEDIKATAINDYAVNIPRADWVDGGPIVAFLNHGEKMPVRNKGPLWIVYPFDQKPEYQTEQIYSRAIWQLDRIIVLD